MYVSIDRWIQTLDTGKMDARKIDRWINLWVDTQIDRKIHEKQIDILNLFLWLKRDR